MILLDISRLLSRLDAKTPTGIDRVEFEYSQNLLTKNAGFVALNSQQVVQVPRWLVAAILSHLDARWHCGDQGNPKLNGLIENWKRMSGVEIHSDPIHSFFADLMRRKARARWQLIQAERVSIEERAGVFPWILTAPALFVAPGTIARFISPSLNPKSFKRRVVLDRIAVKTIYLNVGHSNLERREIFDEIRKVDGISLAFYLHDLLPLSHPELFKKGGHAKHQLAMETTVEFGNHIFTNSIFTRDELTRLIPGSQVSATLEIGQSPRRSSPVVPPQERHGFVSIGTIEPRKNFVWLVQNWLKFCSENSDLVGKEFLTIFGKKGWIDKESYSELMRMAEGSKHVKIISDASDETVLKAVSQARGYVSAAHVEGWGMPLAESLQSGTPVIATNIAAHKEVTQGIANFFQLNDSAEFSTHLARHFDRQALGTEIDRTRTFSPWSWEAHFQKLHDILGV